jgi:ubiquinol-cytochrome c reductase cytochrome b/c1 subunit
MKNSFILSILYRNLVVLVTSCDLSRLYCVGFLLGNIYLLQIVSGVCLSFLYMSLNNFAAFYVILEILDMEAGFLVRSIHITGTSFCFFLLYIHIFKVFYHTLLHSASGLSYSLGIIVYFLSVVIAFIGYVLPLSQMSFWGLTVFSNIISAVPSVGPLICFWLWGGEFIQDYTLTKVFSLHVFMPFLLLFVVLFHLLALHSHLSSDTFEDRFAFYYERCLFTGFFLYRDLAILALISVTFSYMAIIYWDFVFHEESFEVTNVVKTPDKIIPE